MTGCASLLLAAVTVGTWNGQWFPSGRAEHRASAAVEAATIAKAGKMLRAGLDLADATGTNDIILCLNEIRNEKVAKALCDAIGRTNLTVAVTTGYRRRDRFDMQQDVIATTLPVVSANWSRWRQAKADTPPRGYAEANVLLSPSVTAAVYAVHLKSNYGQTTEEAARSNRTKRMLSVMQLMEIVRPKRRSRKPPAPVVIAGDMNADKWNGQAQDRAIFDLMAEAGFKDAMEGLEPGSRVTHPGRGRRNGSTLDYIMLRSLEPDGPPVVVGAEGVSDHNAIFVNLR